MARSAVSTSIALPGAWMEMPGSVSSSATSPGAWCGAAARGDVEGAAGADQHAADVLVPEPELDLLEGPLDQERAERVHDRPHPGERQPGADVDEQLLADADVDHPLGVLALDLPEELAGDLGVDQRRPTRRSRPGRRPSGRTGCGRPSVLSFHGGDDDVGASELAVRQRLLQGVVVAAVDGDRVPALGGEALLDPAGHGVRRRAVVDHHDGERLQEVGGGQLEGLVVAALVELRVTDQDHHSGGQPWARMPSAVPTASGSP